MKSDWSDMPDEMLQEIEEIRDSLEPTESQMMISARSIYILKSFIA